MTDLQAQKLSIRKVLLDTGFIEARFSKISVVEDRRFDAWLKNGFHGDMAWLSRNRNIRNDPRLLFADAKTIISLALPYLSTISRRNKLFGISRYAQGSDYHIIVKKMLKSCITLIQSEINAEFQARIAVDSAPVMEKYWAVSSGLGWQGKNSNIINRQFGSYFFIAELICNVDYPSDSQVQDMCGSCSKCMDACPTGAIVQPYIVDSNKCLSYQTIESKNLQWSSELSSRHSECVFGCDICQEVCPWNKFAVESKIDAFNKREFNDLNYPLYWCFVSEAEFKIRYRSSAVLRAGYRKYLENLHVVLRRKEERNLETARRLNRSYMNFLRDIPGGLMEAGDFYCEFSQWVKENKVHGTKIWDNWHDYSNLISSIYSEQLRNIKFEMESFKGKQFVKSLGYEFFDFCEWISAKMDTNPGKVADAFSIIGKENLFSFSWHFTIFIGDRKVSHFDQFSLYHKFLLDFRSSLKVNDGKVEQNLLKDKFEKLKGAKSALLLQMRTE